MYILNTSREELKNIRGARRRAAAGFSSRVAIDLRMQSGLPADGRAALLLLVLLVQLGGAAAAGKQMEYSAPMRL
jgi:hypothetical protein